MRSVFFLLFTLNACRVDGFFSISEGGLPTSDSSSESSTDADSGKDPVDSSGLDVREADEGSSTDAGLCPDPNDVEHEGHCYYLDGSKGVCDQGYTLSSNAKLALVLAAKPNAWQGKSYRHAVSDNCCVLTKDSVENYGMVSTVNVPGPFDAGEPALGGSGCTMKTNLTTKQLTLCESL